MSWMESSSNNHSCGCHKKNDHKHHKCDCHKKDDHKHHKCDCHKKDDHNHHRCNCHEKRDKCDKCSWNKHRYDNEWRRRCRNRQERVQVFSRFSNSWLDNRIHKKRKKIWYVGLRSHPNKLLWKTTIQIWSFFLLFSYRFSAYYRT